MGKIYSMTGYASSTTALEGGDLICEIRSLNSRYLEIFLKLPQSLKAFEDQIKGLIRKKINRGKINCVLTATSADMFQNGLQVNAAAVKLYRDLLENIREAADITAPLQLNDLLLFKDVFTVDEEKPVDEALQEKLSELLNTTLDELNSTRSEEGENLRKDLSERLNTIQKLAKEVGNYGTENARVEFDKQYERLKKMIDENKLDRNRLELEVAIISDRVDISEEIVRLQSHITLFRDNLENGSPIGKKLNFILQEMHREANTMSSKNTMIDISHRVVTIKEEIERMREQVQNIE